MCQRCLWSPDSIEWLPVHVGGPLKFPRKRQRSPNWSALRGNEESNIPGWKRRPQAYKERIDFDPGKDDYSARDLEQLADQFLRDDARSVDPDTGKEKGIGGKDPILFAEHLYQRQKREILNENGVPEPGLVQGIYNRAHPEGRKINSEEQRRKNGASYYR